MSAVNRDFIKQVGALRWASRYGYFQFHKRVLNRNCTIRLPTGGRMVLPRQSHSAAEVFVTNADLDWGAEAIFASFADPTRDFLDIGAHVGFYSMYLSPLVRRAHAFEPDARNLPGLRANAEIAGNVEVHDLAVSSRDGIDRFYVGGSSSISSVERSGDAATDNADSVMVRLTTVDSFVSARPDASVGLIKTDIEGHDAEALKGMARTVAAHSPLILTECDEAVAPICAGWGYRIYAHTRDRLTLETTFREMSGDDLGGRWYKMLFLAPPHLHAAFDRLVAANGRSPAPGADLAFDPAPVSAPHAHRTT